MKITALLLATMLAAPAIAQTTTPAPAPVQGAAGPDRTGAVTDANAGVAADVAADDAGRTIANADVRAQYDADLLAYDQAIAAHHRAVRRTDRAYARQQRAYAAAMADWRDQTAACKRGVLRMCSKPTPDPANYF